jgi:hypothetical protein
MVMKKTLAVLLIMLASITLIISCSKGGGTSMIGGGGGGGGGGTTLDCSLVPKSFVTDVNPIVQNFCNTAGCHDAGSANGPGPLTNFAQVFNARASIRSAIASGLMPQGSSLTIAQKNSFLCWIDSGAPNN